MMTTQAPFILYACSTAMMGVWYAAIGPVLPDLEKQTNVARYYANKAATGCRKGFRNYL